MTQEEKKFSNGNVFFFSPPGDSAGSQGGLHVTACPAYCCRASVAELSDSQILQLLRNVLFLEWHKGALPLILLDSSQDCGESNVWDVLSYWALFRKDWISIRAYLRWKFMSVKPGRWFSYFEWRTFYFILKASHTVLL